MSGSIELGTVEFLSVKDAAQRARYSRDYVARLAREGKVIATQIDRQWFVDPVSLKNFVETTELEKEIRSRQLRDLRKQERALAEEKLAMVSRVEVRATKASPRASWQAFLVVCSGLMLGVVLHSASQFYTPQPQGNQVVAQLPQSSDANTAKEIGVETVVSLTDESIGLEVGTRSFDGQNGILLLPEGVASTTVVEAETFFSDEVEVRYVNEREGEVTPRFRDSDGRSVKFVRVPVKTDGTSVTTYE